MNILAIGDVCGKCGRRILTGKLPGLRRLLGADLVIVNGENANDNGRGLSPDAAREFYYAGADIITLGNHAFDDRRLGRALEEERYLVRPENLPPRTPGKGYAVADVEGMRVCVCSLLGMVEMNYLNGNPFEAAEALLKNVQADIYVFDFHGEATSEKMAFGFRFDGRASVVFGTHTHVPTRDLRILPRGTGYITDLGMTGSGLSVLGAVPRGAVERFLGDPWARLEYSEEDPVIMGALFTLDSGGRCADVRPVEVR